MWTDLLRALALVLVIEGLMPFLAPERWREVLLQVSRTQAGTLRWFGGGAIVLGLVLLQVFGR